MEQSGLGGRNPKPMTGFLLDTHALIWMFVEPVRMPQRVVEAIQHPRSTTFYSAASVMEIATKHRIGKLPSVQPLLAQFEDLMAEAGLSPLAITIAHARRAGSMLTDHKDPFDRFLVAQALCDDLVLLSLDAALDPFGIRRLW
jgi:PIN domain nuclease of toxin-antitoxin system